MCSVVHSPRFAGSYVFILSKCLQYNCLNGVAFSAEIKKSSVLMHRFVGNTRIYKMYFWDFIDMLCRIVYNLGIDGMLLSRLPVGA